MKQTIMEYLDREQGTVPELLRARETMPEPARWASDFYQVRLVEESPWFLSNKGLSPCDPVCPVRTAVFEKVELATEHAGRFLAWRHLLTGKLYI